MQSFSFTPTALTREGKPWFPVMGGMRYSRTDRRYWQESLALMARGVVQASKTPNTASGVGCYRVGLGKLPAAHNWLLAVRYTGDRVELYLDGEMIADHYYDGLPWEIGLNHFDFPQSVELRVYPPCGAGEAYFEPAAENPAGPCGVPGMELTPVLLREMG